MGVLFLSVVLSLLCLHACLNASVNQIIMPNDWIIQYKQAGVEVDRRPTVDEVATDCISF